MDIKSMFEGFELGGLRLPNRFVFPPIKTAYGTPAGAVTNKHLTYSISTMPVRPQILKPPEPALKPRLRLPVLHPNKMQSR